MKDIYQISLDKLPRSEFTFSSADIRLNKSAPAQFCLTQNTNSCKYPIGTTFYVECPAFAPTALKAWSLLDVWQETPTDDEDAQVTSVDYRLTDGTDTYWWDGAAWDTSPTASEWNTLDELNTNLATFPGTGLGMVFRLQTTDGRYTPGVAGYKILWELSDDFSCVEDLVHSCIVPTLSGIELGPITFDLEAPGSPTRQIDLASTEYGLVADYDVSSVSAVYNITDDPTEATNLYSSFAGSVIQLTADVEYGKELLVYFKYTIPVVAAYSSRDFEETTKVPHIALLDISFENPVRVVWNNYVRDIAANTAVGLKHPYEVDLTCELVVVADKVSDVYRISEALQRKIEFTAKLESAALDREFDWMTDIPFDFSELKRLNEESVGVFPSSSTAVRINKAHILSGTEVAKYLVSDFQPTVLRKC